MSGDVERLAEVIEREVYCTVIIRPEHDPNCNGDCGRYGCPIPVQDYGEISDLARAVLGSDWLAAHDAEVAARALREAADVYFPPGKPLRSWEVQDWLRARADRVADHTPQEQA